MSTCLKMAWDYLELALPIRCNIITIKNKEAVSG
jgi:hypothetical protein